MKRIDYKSLTEQAAKEISQMSTERRGGFLNRYVTRIEVTPDLVRQMLLEKVWDKCVDQLNAQYADTEPLAVEKAIVLLKKGGAIKEEIVYRKNSFRLKLENGRYRAYKGGEKGFYASPWPFERRYLVQVSGYRFADFILQFDAEIPEILAPIPEIIAAIKDKELQEMKQQFEKELKEKVVQSLIAQFLEPLGLSVTHIIQKDDRVCIDMVRRMSAHLEIPLSELPEKLKDSASILALLQTDPSENDIKDNILNVLKMI